MSLKRDSFCRDEDLCSLSLTFNFNIKFQYKCVYPEKSLGEEVGGCGKAWGWKNYGFLYFSSFNACLFVSVMHFHKYLCISISPKKLKEYFADALRDL